MAILNDAKMTGLPTQNKELTKYYKVVAKLIGQNIRSARTPIDGPANIT